MQTSSAPPSPHWVMVLDASPTVCRVLEIVFSRAGWWVRSFSDPLVALQYLSQHAATPPEALIFDLELRRLDGFEIIHLLRTQSPEGLRDLPILVLTARDGRLDRLNARLCGCNGYLTKPFQTEQVRDELRRIIALQGPPRG